jgi:hypothetical protein
LTKFINIFGVSTALLGHPMPSDPHQIFFSG